MDLPARAVAIDANQFAVVCTLEAPGVRTSSLLLLTFSR
jgi:hypothetical protein